MQLDATDAEFFNHQTAEAGLDHDTFGAPAAQMEEFNPDLPDIELPPIGDRDSAESTGLHQAAESEFSQPAHIVAPDAPVNNSARAELEPSAEVPTAMNAADTERLRQMAELERRQRQRRQIQVRAGQTGFKGYCPVALRERRELVESSELFSSTFGLQTYSFSSAESKAAFDTDPSRYAPAAGGSDVVVLVNSGEEPAGQLDYALWYRDRLYLFQSRETMTLFFERSATICQPVLIFSVMSRMGSQTFGSGASTRAGTDARRGNVVARTRASWLCPST